MAESRNRNGSGGIAEPASPPALSASLPVSSTRRHFLQAGAATLATGVTLPAGAADIRHPAHAPAAGVRSAPPAAMPVSLKVNGQSHALELDPRTTLLDALREHLHLTGTKKGCDHGQCGACTVLVNGNRINSCLSLAVMHDGDEITSIEGLATGEKLHDMQAAFLKHDGFQCGYCTPGQICSAIGMLNEVRRGVPSYVTADLKQAFELSDEEIRERMSGNICRCAAYTNIVAAIKDAAGQKT